ncbi:hypothetical protein FA95DRAFT_1208805 [Auriscalpium vulgare]|uniref:Uncharacterized protein n=1 Tax=Auriscalpium vulgare TaxID=40419 RepID=A0ACB8RTH6_9AGAM|nr:hypothetical protein FA95DRAFT_1208805 [Auriscalpium vulgare]
MSPARARHARFNENPVVETIPPSPTSSASSLEGSPGPSTPPPLMDSPNYSPQYSPQYTPHPHPHHLSSYPSPVPVPQVYTPSPVYHSKMLTPQAASVSIPSPQAKSIHLNPVLLGIKFDVAIPPLLDPLLAEPATEPAVAAMTLATPLLPWQISVCPQPGMVVTVGDVLFTIYHELRKSVKRREYDALSPALRAGATSAFNARVAVDPSQAAKGVRRVDVLCGHTSMEGLTSTAEEGKWLVLFR